jgi:hypothetical protein
MVKSKHGLWAGVYVEWSESTFASEVLMLGIEMVPETSKSSQGCCKHTVTTALFARMGSIGNQMRINIVFYLLDLSLTASQFTKCS